MLHGRSQYNSLLKKIKHDGTLIKDVPSDMHTFELWDTAIRQNPSVIEFLPRDLEDEFPELRQIAALAKVDGKQQQETQNKGTQTKHNCAVSTVVEGEEEKLKKIK